MVVRESKLNGSEYYSLMCGKHSKVLWEVDLVVLLVFLVTYYDRRFVTDFVAAMVLQVLTLMVIHHYHTL